MKLQDSQNRINELMSRFVAQVKGATAMRRTDINSIAETMLIPLLAEVYGYTSLKNLNITKDAGYPAVDLGDKVAGTAIQVTSTSSSEKVKNTLRKFIKYRLYEEYHRLIIYILTEKQQSYSGSGYDEILQGKFAFDKDEDIRDYRDVLQEISGFQIDKALRVEKILEDYLGVTAQSAAPGGSAARSTPEQLHRKCALTSLKRLLTSEFEEVVFHYEMPGEYLPTNVSQVQKAIALIDYAMQREGDSIPKLLNAIYSVAPHLKEDSDGSSGRTP